MDHHNETTSDALVIGGGPAGLQAALTLARVHRHVVLVDDNRPRNAAASRMYNFITHDGTPPSVFREHGRRDLAAYDTVTLLDDSVREVRRTGDGFVAHTESGQELRARRVVLATGVRDELPEIDGLEELWGTLVHHCPFCHGHELAGGRVGLLASPSAAHLTGIIGPFASEVVVLEDVVGVKELDGRLEVRLGDGSTTELDGLFVATNLHPAAPHAEQLGLTTLESGAVEVDLLGRTSDPQVFAAGDLAHHRDLPMPSGSVLAAAAAGQVAGSACLSSLLAD
ncbi:NAD(P)/FAD-dependent oxidoreductase [Nocardioides jishulii]|uniref:NAD(P)/FAD-dependent oxidoreductase n=1 Tax=Nocardioides jishulii TaxID=2575440 RepID=A0A4U2YRI6_9ACTN|nr:NAD(P)/FAD-dependent oxidoreductase [Nocardioides jishulii]QCX26172.1 NAD(P)/FAD-dependent oxidoreductase [Nocardioides jishulii]TKI64029.1 NAD(P)/FAD-dependent oxidoreductase [Nocardioides jishulii]